MLLSLTSSLSSCSSIKISRFEGDIVADNFIATAKFLHDQKEHIVNVQIVATKNNQVRMEFSSKLGINLASLALYNDYLSYYIHGSHEYYSGKNDIESFGEFDIFISLNNLVDFLYEKVPVGFSCTKENGKLLSCHQADTLVSFKTKKDSGRLIDFKNKKTYFQIYIKNKEPNIKVNKDIFKIKKP